MEGWELARACPSPAQGSRAAAAAGVLLPRLGCPSLAKGKQLNMGSLCSLEKRSWGPLHLVQSRVSERQAERLPLCPTGDKAAENTGRLTCRACGRQGIALGKRHTLDAARAPGAQLLLGNPSSGHILPWPCWARHGLGQSLSRTEGTHLGSVPLSALQCPHPARHSQGAALNRCRRQRMAAARAVCWRARSLVPSSGHTCPWSCWCRACTSCW